MEGAASGAGVFLSCDNGIHTAFVASNHMAEPGIRFCRTMMDSAVHWLD